MDAEEYRKIIKSAIAGEIEASQFYQGAAQALENDHLKKMFLELADEERKHRDILRGILSSQTIGDFFDETQDFGISETMDSPELSMDMKPADAFALAMKKEEEAMRHYAKLAAGCQDQDKKKVFLDLAAMERGHKLKMEKAFVDVGYPEVW